MGTDPQVQPSQALGEQLFELALVGTGRWALLQQVGDDLIEASVVLLQLGLLLEGEIGLLDLQDQISRIDIEAEAAGQQLRAGGVAAGGAGRIEEGPLQGDSVPTLSCGHQARRTARTDQSASSITA